MKDLKKRKTEDLLTPERLEIIVDSSISEEMKKEADENCS